MRDIKIDLERDRDGYIGTEQSRRLDEWAYLVNQCHNSKENRIGMVYRIKDILLPEKMSK